MANMLPPVIQKAMAINPAPGSTFYDAEHIVFLMQENRSFDHQLGTCCRACAGLMTHARYELPDKNKVWFQTNKAGDTYGPFRLNVKDTKVAWMGSIPHGWTDQTDAMNNGKYDRWLDVQKRLETNIMPIFRSLWATATVTISHSTTRSPMHLRFATTTFVRALPVPTPTATTG
jgi:phospholipase C